MKEVESEEQDGPTMIE
jgi:DNA repair protein RAD51